MDRLPLHRGPFYFVPRYLQTREEWFEAFSALLTEVLDQVGRKADDLTFGDGWQVQVRLNTLIFAIDAEGGMFYLREPDDDWDPDRFWIAEIPSEFRTRLQLTSIPEHLVADTILASDIAGRLHRVMKSRFEQALKAGDAHFEARLGTELADHARVSRDQMSLFDIDRKLREVFFEVDDELDSATARESGAKLFSLCVVPAGGEVTILPKKRGEVGKAVGRPETVDHEILEEVGLELMRSRGVPGPKKAHWTGEIYAKAVLDKMAARGLIVSRATVLNKKPLIIEKFRKEQSRKHFLKSKNPKIYQN